MIYPVDSAIRRLNNRGLTDNLGLLVHKNEKNRSSELRKGPGNGLKNKALWVIGLINMAVLAGPVYVDVVCELNNYR